MHTASNWASDRLILVAANAGVVFLINALSFVEVIIILYVGSANRFMKAPCP
ncbi:hypothetical protein [Nostoc sp.]|uniref:hypothetical protein n=1 Tax=Nostoc sp. TaxID=1180 RepID=UPI002FFD4DE4